MNERRRSAWPFVALAGIAAGIVIFRLIPSDWGVIYSTRDIALHGGWSFVLCLGGQYVAWRRLRTRANEWAVFAIVVMIGLAVEVVQHYLLIDSVVGDLLIDTLGAAAGWAFWRIVRPMLDAREVTQ